MKLLSGGQSGVDRAVLDVAIARAIPCAGWCPKGGWAEDFPQPPGLLTKYPQLSETPASDPAQRTAWNIRDADGCMILADADGLATSRGTALAAALIRQGGKPFIVIPLGPMTEFASQANDTRLADAGRWLHAQQHAFGDALIVAIGGPRESEIPGIYARAKKFLDILLMMQR